MKSIKDLPIVVRMQRGDEKAPVWTIQVEASKYDPMSSAPPDMMIVATFNARAALKDWEPRD